MMSNRKKLILGFLAMIPLLLGLSLYAQFGESDELPESSYQITEPIQDSECKYYGYWDHLIAPEELLGHVNMGMSFNAYDAEKILDEGLSVIVNISHTLKKEESVDQWRAKLRSYGKAIRKYDPEDVAFVMLYDEPFRLGFTTEETELMVDLAREIIGDEYKYGFAFMKSNAQSSSTPLPQNLDVVGINFYPFFEEDYATNTVQTKLHFTSAFNLMMRGAREKAPNGAEFMIAGQGFQQPEKWAKPPLESPIWYAELVRDTEDVIGLMWFEWRNRSRWLGTKSFPELFEVQKEAFDVICPQA